MHNKKRLIYGLGIGLLMIIAYFVYLYIQPDPLQISYNEFLEAVMKERLKGSAFRIKIRLMEYIKTERSLLQIIPERRL